MNAAVNFNRISELLPAYLNDYINWEPDVIIVGSSLNNFAGGITASGRLLGKHPWEAEFQRLVNDAGIASSFEVLFRRLSDNLVTVAVVGKFVQKLGYYVEPKPIASPSAKINPAIPVEEKNTDRLNEQNLGRFKSYASAMLAAAQTRNQKVVFFWEHDLWNSAAFKQLLPDEILLEKINPPLDNPFYWQQRDWVRDFAKDAGAGFIDPQPEMAKYQDTIFIDYGHYTAGGNAFMAKVMASRLLEKNLCSFKGQVSLK
ncbi:MAG: hypothetical protein ACXU7H_05695 [Burkholderiaceae bacterium]